MSSWFKVDYPPLPIFDENTLVTSIRIYYIRIYSKPVFRHYHLYPFMGLDGWWDLHHYLWIALYWVQCSHALNKRHSYRVCPTQTPNSKHVEVSPASNVPTSCSFVSFKLPSVNRDTTQAFHSAHWVLPAETFLPLLLPRTSPFAGNMIFPLTFPKWFHPDSLRYERTYAQQNQHTFKLNSSCLIP